MSEVYDACANTAISEVVVVNVSAEQQVEIKRYKTYKRASPRIWSMTNYTTRNANNPYKI